MTVEQLKVLNRRLCSERTAGTASFKFRMPLRPGLIPLAVVLLAVAGCAKVPDGSHFEVTRGELLRGFFLTDQKLTLPWVALSATGQYK